MRSIAKPRSSTRLVLLLALAATLIVVERGQGEDYLVGVAKVDITPSYPVRLNGFGNRRNESAGVLHPIWAKAIAIGGDDQRPAVLITMDNLGVRQPMVKEVAARLMAKAGIEPDRVAITFTHTHTAPKVNGASDTIFSSPIPPDQQEHIDRYTRELTDALEQVALAALADRQPARLEWAVGKVGFAKNRRTPGGPVDHSLPLLVVRSAADGAVRALYLSYACHCVTLSNNKIGGDWAGFAQRAIEAEHPGAIALVSIGCGSDANPSSGVTGANTAAAAEQGGEVADEVDRLLAGSLKPVSGPLAATLNYIELPLNPAPSREELETAAAQGEPGYNAQVQLARLDRGEPLLTAIDYPIQTWAFGDSLAMVFLAGEVCVDYSLRLKQELDAERLWVHGYSNDFCCYIPSERLLKEGGYGGGGEINYFDLPNTLQAGVEQRIIDEVHRQVPPQFKRPASGATQSSAQPLEKSLAAIQTKGDFIVEIAAAEPFVADPVAIDFGPDGRMWVAEMTDYSHEVEEQFEQTGSVRVLTDRDGDGRFDEAATFQDGLRFPTDVKVWGAGVIVCDAPDVIYLEDANGDGRADVRKTLLTGFDMSNAQARVNSLRWGLDNWVYGAGGLLGGHIKSWSGVELALGSRDFRFRPDTGELEAVTGKTQQGRANDDWGNWFGCENGTLIRHYPLSDKDLARNPHITPPATEVFVPAGADPNQLFPIGQPTLLKLSGAPGRPTSACGLGIYRDELLGAEFSNNAFVAEPVNNLVHRRVLSPRGATFSGDRANGEEDAEFLASTESWFRPVQIRTGLDGCLWIIDMHRAVIEHKRWIPEDTLQELDLMAGREQGRIYRVRPRSIAARLPVRLDQLDAAGLAGALDSPNGPQRDLTQQLLVQRRAMEAAPRLKELAARAKRPATRLQAMCTLDGLGALDAKLLVQRLADPHAAVRRHAIRLSETFLASSPELVDAVLGLVDDSDPQVQLQLGYTLGEIDDPRAAKALARLAWARRDDPYVLAGIWSSVDADNVGAMVDELLSGDKQRDLPPSLADPLIGLALKIGDDACLETIAEGLNRIHDGQIASWRLEAAARLLEGQRQKEHADAAATARLQAQLAPVVELAQQMVDGAIGDEPDRLAALRLLVASGTSQTELIPLLSQLLRPQNSLALQEAAVRGLASSSDPRAGAALLGEWNAYTPGIRGQVFDVVLGRSDLLAALLGDIEDGDLRATGLDALQRQRLLAHADPAIRKRAIAALAGAIDADRERVVASYAAAVGDGEATRGREVFVKHCSSCHVLEGQGHAVGPDLAALTSRTHLALLEAIFDPNRAVDERYRSYTALTVDGLAHAGILTGETSNSITLVEQQGKRHTLLRNELDALQNSGKSLMPEGLERDVTPADASDLLAYLTTQAPPPKTFDGNVPQVVSADPEGALWLLATNGKIFGQDIVFEPVYENIGYWYGEHDHVAWDVDAKDGGEFDVYLHWASADDSAGNAVIVEGCEPPAKFHVGATGSYDRYQTKHIGRTTLAPGIRRIVVRPDGPLIRPNLLDLRGLYFVPVGASAERAKAGQPPSRRRDAATEIESLLKGLRVRTSEEYERIPAIWEHAIAAGKRNDAAELARLLNLALPQRHEALADWQAVVLGGGIINGLSQSGHWPQTRLAELFGDDDAMTTHWERVVKLAATMADNEPVRAGTRYDALRILGAADFKQHGRQLVHYLAKGSDHELQMGAVSGLSDMESPEAAAALLQAIPQLDEHNRVLAIDALLRTEARRLTLKQAVSEGKVVRQLLSAEQLAKLPTPK